MNAETTSKLNEQLPNKNLTATKTDEGNGRNLGSAKTLIRYELVRKEKIFKEGPSKSFDRYHFHKVILESSNERKKIDSLRWTTAKIPR